MGINYQEKYLKYKNKYLQLKKQLGGMIMYIPSKTMSNFRNPKVPFEPENALFNINEYPNNYDKEQNPIKPSPNPTVKNIVVYNIDDTSPLLKFFGLDYTFKYNNLHIGYPYEHDEIDKLNIIPELFAVTLGLVKPDFLLSYNLSIFIKEQKIIIVDFPNMVNLLYQNVVQYGYTEDINKELIKFSFIRLFYRVHHDRDLSLIIIAKNRQKIKLDLF